ncbi:hypothetical protein LTR56_007139 [Elasticomyces elasticus]|nr:hypothetical protein LTR22_020440 [Elasticomyces elasticus]KAK3649007.1 hypothetical protein LTR56_007139 [Elasticomyces elasticus]KAK4917793.1 hypothetical protein LTR49_014330 [Elasticomyces elasticus]KAK5740463.1 hypothetical protein LTS12_024951 [Elasticomyces elasticus]
MLQGTALPATATASTYTSTSSATPTSPRPSRLRGLSYLRSYTSHHLHSSNVTPPTSRSEAPPLTRSTSYPNSPTRGESGSGSGIQNGESGWVPSVQGRSGLSRDSAQLTATTTVPAAPEPSSSMTRSRAATALGPTPTNRRQSTTETTAVDPATSTDMATSASSSTAKDSLPTIRFIPHVETRSTRPSLLFTTMSRTLRTTTSIVRVGRYSERDNNNNSTTQSTSDFLPVGFKSKVVSRRHCEFWHSNSQWYIRDVKSSSGTFLNHVRLSPPGQESRPFEVNDGDTVQLGIDFKGGEEVIFRCVKIRIECNRGWQKSLNAYNTTAHKRLLKNAGVVPRKTRDSDAASVNSSSECSICLNPVAPCQALFVAPCSHVWHYKCVRNLVHGSNYPNFLCPNCRFVADLEADVEPVEEDEMEFEEEEEEADGEVGASREEEMEGQRQGSSDTDELALSSRPEGRVGGSEDDDLAILLAGASLDPSSQHNSSSDLSAAPTTPGKLTATATRPVAISPPPGQRSSASDLLGAGAFSTTPTSTMQFALLAEGGMIADGPMTPRNDAGPFVLDGSAGRSVGRGILEQVVGDEREREG